MIPCPDCGEKMTLESLFGYERVWYCRECIEVKIGLFLVKNEDTVRVP